MTKKQFGWAKVWDIYSWKKFKKGARKPAVLLIVSAMAYLLKGNVSECELTSLLANMIVTGFPSILGFVLTAYALIVGFSDSEFLLSMAKKQLSNGHTLFETVNATFAVVIGFLVTTYILSVAITLVLGLKIVWPFETGIHVFNSCVFFILLFFLYYSICALLDIVVNVFNLGQFANIVVRNLLQVREHSEDASAEDDLLDEENEQAPAVSP